MDRINLLGRKVRYIFFFTLIVNLTFFMALSVGATTDPPYEIQWGVQRGSTGTEIAYGIAGDNAGSIYVTGNTDGSIDGQRHLGANDLFLIKYDDNGSWKWTRQLGSNPGNEWANAVAVFKNTNGDAYVVGRTNGAMPGYTKTTNDNDVFIVKYNSNGNSIWIKQIGSSGQDIAFAAGIDQTGNIYITGRTNGSLPGHTNRGGNDMFLLKYDPAGNLLWSRQAGTAFDDEAFALAIDSANRIYIGGYTAGTYNGPGESHNVNAGGKDILVMRFDSNGNFCCSKQYGSALDDVATAIAVDSFDNIFIVGNKGSATVSTVPTLMKCNLYGTVWSKDLELQVEEIVSSLAVDHMNNIYVAGHANINRDGIVSKDISVAKYDSTDGTLLWTKQIGTTVDERATSLTTDESGSVYVTGCTNGSLFGTNKGYSDVVVVKLVDVTPPAGTVKINNDAAYANSTSVTLNLACNDGSGSGCSAMRFRNDNSTWSDWITRTAALSWTVNNPWTLTNGDGTKTVYVQYRDVAGNVSTDIISDNIILDTTPPAGSIIINSDAAYTNTSSVTLTISCTDALSGCSQMRFSNDNSTWSAWESVASGKSWTLTSGDGTKTVYAQYRDVAGNIAGFSDTVILDTTPPSGSIIIDSGAQYANKISVTLTISCTDALSGCSQMRFSNDNSTWSSWEAAAGSKAWTLTSGDGPKRVYVQFRDELGNISSYSDTITLSTNPDLAVSAIAAPASGGAGLTINITDTIRNNGPGGAAATVTKFYLSTNSTFEASDVLIGSRTVPSLAPAATSMVTTSVVIPPATQPGTYFIIAKADGDNDITERIKTNNIRAKSIKIGPDLVVSAITAPTSAGAGATITISDTITNKGAGTADASVIRFYFSRDKILDESFDALLGSRDVSEIIGGAANTGSTTVTIPADTATGTYYIIAKADADGLIPELNETNNIRAKAIRVGMDLIVQAISAPALAGAGATISITDTTRNNGPGRSASSITKFYLSADNSLGVGDIELGSRVIPELAATMTSAEPTSITIPEGTATGTYYIIAKADADDLIPELNETNNVRAKAIKIGPDLVVSTITAPASAGAGATIAISDTITNKGAGTAGTSVIRFYFSRDNILDESDALSGSRNVPEIEGGAANTDSTTVTIPAGTTAGTYYIIAKADAGDVVSELAENNNTKSRSIKITQ